MSRTTKATPAEARKRRGFADEPFLARWSRRKREARAQVAPAPETTPATTEPAKPERVLTDADMPPLETLTSDSDYSLFLSPGVSEKLRRAALRKLFHSPEFNELCPLEGEYFNAAGFAPLGSVVTHEMRAALEKEARALKKALPKEESAATEHQEKPVQSASADTASPDETSPVPQPEPAATPADDMPARRYRGHVRRRAARSQT